MIKIISKFNKENLIIFVHDPTLSYYFEKNNFNIISPYKNNNSDIELNTSNTVVLIKTFRGSIDKEKYDNMMRSFENTNNYNIETFNLGYDKFSLIKKHVYDYYPEYSLIIKIYNNINLSEKDITEWQ